MRRKEAIVPESMKLADGRSITLLESVGRGSLGEVFRGVINGAWGLRRTVAVKLFEASTEDDQAELHRRLVRVARRSVCMRHPSVVQVLEVDRAQRNNTLQSFVVTELVSGESLASLLATWRDGGVRVPIDFALVVALKVAEALAGALASELPDGNITSLIHGDLSPRQILVSDQGDVKVGDFGQGTFRDAVSHVRSRHGVAYTAPELACGLEADARSDVFALGAILYEMLVGPRFAPRTSTSDMMQMVRAGTFHENVLAPNLPNDLRNVIERAVAADPRGRYPHARAFAYDLRREMLRIGLCDVQASIRQAVVGWRDDSDAIALELEEEDDAESETALNIPRYVPYVPYRSTEEASPSSITIVRDDIVDELEADAAAESEAPVTRVGSR